MRNNARMKSVALAARYARALLQLAAEHGATATVVAQAHAMADALDDATLAHALANPRLSLAQRRALVEALAKAVRPHTLLANLLGVLATNRRLGALPAILSEIRTQADAAEGRARVKVEAAHPLSAAQRDMLTATVKQALKVSSVDIEEVPAPALQAGFRAFFGGRVWDASLTGNLRRLKDAMFTRLDQPV